MMGDGNGELIWVTPALSEDGQTYPSMYTNFNGVELSYASPGYTRPVQPGEDYPGTVGWQQPVGEWFTLMFHVRPGTHNSNMNVQSQQAYQEQYALAANKDTAITVYAHKRGESGPHHGGFYKVFEMLSLAWFYWGTIEEYGSAPAGSPQAFNAIALNHYMGSGNNVPAGQDCWNWFDQIIFSHSPIACPNDGEG